MTCYGCKNRMGVWKTISDQHITVREYRCKICRKRAITREVIVEKRGPVLVK